MRGWWVTAAIVACGSGTTSPAPELADVVDVQVRGSADAYTFEVSVRSPDTGCDRYADWWEVVTPDGTLVHRRILAHSHVGEQPFTRSSGPIPVAPDDDVIVRAHLAPDGYGGAAFRGTVDGGFAPATVESGWADALAQAAPLPDGCAF